MLVTDEDEEVLGPGDCAFICDACSIADIACWTWVDQYCEPIGGRGDFPSIAGWRERIAVRPAVRRGLTIWMPDSAQGWSIDGRAPQVAES